MGTLRETGFRGFRWPRGYRAALSLSFDDARESQIDPGFSLLDRLGVRATFYVLPQHLDRHRASWLAARRDGHEIGNHSTRHPCTGNFEWSRSFRLEDTSVDEVRADIEHATVLLSDLFGTPPVTFAYPCGQTFVGRGPNHQSYVPVIAELFLAGRGYGDEFSNDPTVVDLSSVGALSFSRPVQWILDAIDETARHGKWLVLAGHDIGLEGPQGTSTETISIVVEHAHRQGLWIDTVAGVAAWVSARHPSESLPPPTGTGMGAILRREY